MKPIEAYPLQWPAGWKRSQFRSVAQFHTQFGAARDHLFRELARMSARAPILSTNIPLRNDGLPYANFSQPSDPGAAIYFQLKGRPMVFACDRWNKVTDNVQAIRLTVGALRGIERWGASDMLERAFAGFAQLPAPLTGGVPWREVLGVDGRSSLEEARRRRNLLAGIYHPDTGVSPDQTKMAEVNAAYSQAEQDLK